MNRLLRGTTLGWTQRRSAIMAVTTKLCRNAVATFSTTKRENFLSSPTLQDIDHFSSLLGGDENMVVGNFENHPILPQQQSSSAGAAATTFSNLSLDDYNTDWRKQYRGRSQIVLKPRSVEQVSQILQYCHDRRLPVVPQGGKTGLVGGSVPVHDEIILLLDRMNRIYRIDDDGILYCQAGCILSNLQDAARHRGLFVPIDLGSKGSCQLGGNLSSNAGGQYYYRYGSLAANLVGMQFVLSTGKILNINFSIHNQSNCDNDHHHHNNNNQEDGTTTNHHNRDDNNRQNGDTAETVDDMVFSNLKDNTGYKLHQLLLGSEGTLGIITAVALKCPSFPRSQQGVFLGCHTFPQVVELARLAKRELGEILAAFEWMDHSAVRAIQQYNNIQHHNNNNIQIPVLLPSSKKKKKNGNHDDQDDLLPYPHSILVETHGAMEEHDKEKLDRFLEKAVELTTTTTGTFPPLAGVVAQDLTQLLEFWRIRELANPAVASLGYGYKYDLSLPVNKFNEFIQIVQNHVQSKLTNNTQNNEDHDDDPTLLLSTNWGHILDGNLHLNFTTPNFFQANDKVLNSLEPFVFDQVLKMGGSISAEHGIGQSKRKLMFRVHTAETLDVMHAIKNVLDPNGILNPYKVLP